MAYGIGRAGREFADAVERLAKAVKLAESKADEQTNTCQRSLEEAETCPGLDPGLEEA